jgi:hypothetical protein
MVIVVFMIFPLFSGCYCSYNNKCISEFLLKLLINGVRMRVLFLIMAIILGIQSEVWAQKLDYPELNVTPRASTRVNMETKWEGENTMGNTWPLIVAGAGTIAAAAGVGDVIDDESDPNGYSQTTGYLVGAATLGIGLYGAMSYRPYAAMKAKLKRVGGKGTRGQLTKERIAEEELKRLSRIGNLTRWTLALINVGTVSYISGNLSDDPTKKDDRDTADFMTNIATLTALLPIFFSTRWEHVYDEQMKYKKRIYAPVSFVPLMNEPFTGQFASGVGINYRF